MLRRRRLPRLAELDRVTGELLRTRASDVRYERARPGELVHVDVKKLGKVPDGGGWRVHGRGVRRAGGRGGWDYVHVALDDRTRIGYAEVLPDEKGTTCAAFLHRAARWFRDEHGITIERVLTDNAKSYRTSAAWIAVCSALQIKRRFTRPRCPWTNGKAERCNQTLQSEWAYVRAWTSNAECCSGRGRRSRRRSALGGQSADQPPRRLTAVNDVPGFDTP